MWLSLFLFISKFPQLVCWCLCICFVLFCRVLLCLFVWRGLGIRASWKCSGLTPAFVLRDPSKQCSGDHMIVIIVTSDSTRVSYVQGEHFTPMMPPVSLDLYLEYYSVNYLSMILVINTKFE